MASLAKHLGVVGGFTAAVPSAMSADYRFEVEGLRCLHPIEPRPIDDVARYIARRLHQCVGYGEGGEGSRRLFKGSERQRRMYAHELDKDNNTGRQGGRA